MPDPIGSPFHARAGEATTEVDVLLRSDSLYVAPGAGLRLVRRQVLWPLWARWSFAAILLSLTYAVVFPNPLSIDREGVLFWFLGALVWCAPLSRLFAGRDRMTGMRHVWRELWIRPDAPTASPSIVVDGRAVGTAHGTSVWLYEMIVVRMGGRKFEILNYWSVSLLIGGTIYEVERMVDGAATRRIATLLARALGTPNAVRQGPGGRDPTNNIDELASMASLFLPGITCLMAVGHVGPHDAQVILVGALALLARVSAGFWSIARVMAPQLDARGFAKRFPGATPASPLPWLTPRRAMRVLLIAHALLLASVGLVALGRR